MQPMWLKLRNLVAMRVVPNLLRAQSGLTGGFEARMRRTEAVVRYARGHGLELGAAATPAAVPLGVKVTYVDKYGLEELAADPELKGLKIRPPDVLDSAEELTTFAAGSVDFVIAFTVMEHVQDVIAMFAAATRVLKPGGHFIFTAPNRDRYDHDAGRQLTSFDHFVRDFVEGPHVSVHDHYREAGAAYHGLSGAELDAWAKQGVASGGHTHFHVWTAATFMDFVLRTRALLDDAFEVVELTAYGNECLVVGRKPV
ncbi:MAG: methyltransferase domain-containing protein [Sphingomicrobium sp.]